MKRVNFFKQILKLQQSYKTNDDRGRNRSICRHILIDFSLLYEAKAASAGT